MKDFDLFGIKTHPFPPQSIWIESKTNRPKVNYSSMVAPIQPSATTVLLFVLATFCVPNLELLSSAYSSSTTTLPQHWGVEGLLYYRNNFIYAVERSE
jgi:hypothetical protein